MILQQLDMEHPSKVRQEFSTEWWQLWTVQEPKTSREFKYTAKCILQERQERTCPWQELSCQKPILIFPHPANNSQDHSVQFPKGHEFEQNARRCLLQTLLAQHNSLKPGSELKGRGAIRKHANRILFNWHVHFLFFLLNNYSKSLFAGQRYQVRL